MVMGKNGPDFCTLQILAQVLAKKLIWFKQQKFLRKITLLLKVFSKFLQKIESTDFSIQLLFH